MTLQHASRSLRTQAAADYLGVSHNTLRSWERRFGHPSPRRTQGGHRSYDLGELQALRQALHETGGRIAAAAVTLARGGGAASPTGLLVAVDDLDEPAADRLMQEGLAVRSVEGAVEELVLPMIDLALERDGHEAEYEFACRWASAWMQSLRRTAPSVAGPGVLVVDTAPLFDAESLYTQAFELVLRRSGYRTLLLPRRLPPEPIVRALGDRPPPIVVCGGGLGAEPQLAEAIGGRDAPAFEYRGAGTLATLGARPTEAVARLGDALTSDGAEAEEGDER